MTPMMPRPSSVRATRISTGLAVAQETVHTSGTSQWRSKRSPETLSKKDDERVTRADPFGVPSGQVDEIVCVARATDETGIGGLAESDPKAQVRARSCQGLVKVLDRLHEVCLADDDVHAFWLLNGICAQLRGPLLAAGDSYARAAS